MTLDLRAVFEREVGDPALLQPATKTGASYENPITEEKWRLWQLAILYGAAAGLEKAAWLCDTYTLRCADNEVKAQMHALYGRVHADAIRALRPSQAVFGDVALLSQKDRPAEPT